MKVGVLLRERGAVAGREKDLSPNEGSVSWLIRSLFLKPFILFFTTSNKTLH